MQRILHIVGGMDRAGAETMLMNLYRHIDRTQFQFDFIYFMDKKCDYDDEIEQLGGKIYQIIASNPFKRFIALKTFLNTHTEYQIVHSHTLLNSGFNLLAAQLAGVKYRIAHAHSTTNSNSGFTGEIYGSIAKKLIHKYSTFKIACGLKASTYLFSEAEAEILLNGIDVDAYTEIAGVNQNYIRDQFNISATTLVIIQVGRLQEVKNHIFSLQIMKKLKEKKIDFKFLIVGQGSLENDLKQKVKEANLEDKVIFTGVRTDVAQLMAGADLMLMPSYHEGFPVVLVESQAVGLPTLVSTNVSSEVDLDIGLIEFINLDMLDNWVERILEITIGDRMLHPYLLKEKGFDVKSNVLKLQQIYKTMQ